LNCNSGLKIAALVFQSWKDIFFTVHTFNIRRSVTLLVQFRSVTADIQVSFSIGYCFLLAHPVEAQVLMAFLAATQRLLAKQLPVIVEGA